MTSKLFDDAKSFLNFPPFNELFDRESREVFETSRISKFGKLAKKLSGIPAISVLMSFSSLTSINDVFGKSLRVTRSIVPLDGNEDSNEQTNLVESGLSLQFNRKGLIGLTNTNRTRPRNLKKTRNLNIVEKLVIPDNFTIV